MPSPFPSADKIFGFDLKFELSWAGEIDGWTIHGVEMPWFETSPVSGKIDQWMHLRHNPLQVGLALKAEVPLADMGFWSAGSGTERIKACNIAFVTAQPRSDADAGSKRRDLIFAFLPFGGFPSRRRIRGMRLAGLENLEMDATPTPGSPSVFVSPIVLFLRLAAGNDVIQGWHGLIQWRLQGEGRAPNGLKQIGVSDIFSGIWNRAVALATMGGRLSYGGAPWNSLPMGRIDAETCRPLFVFRCFKRDRAPRLIGIVPYNGSQFGDVKNPDCRFEFSWQSASTVPFGKVTEGNLPFRTPSALSGTQLSISGKLNCDALGKGGDRGWNDPSNTQAGGHMSIATVANLVELAKSRAEWNLGGDIIADWEIGGLSVRNEPKPWFSVGSLEFRVRQADAALEQDGDGAEPGAASSGRGEASLRLVLRGDWGEGDTQCDLYPEIELKDLPCEVRMSAGADPSLERLTATFDTIGRIERELHEETGPVLGFVPGLGGDGAGNVIKGRLSIRVLCEPGRNSVTEWRVQRDQTAPPAGSSFYFQARPFTIARILAPDLSPESGLDLAYWRSDDPDGPQWRVADSTVEMDLPPQSIAEEMERGNRFWIYPKQPYIDPSRPLRYRFSPPTRLKISPSLEIRRYHPVPNNLGQILRHAKVEAFTTELVNPVRVDFRADSDGLPDVRVSESISFFGAPSPSLPVVGPFSGQDRWEDEFPRLVADVLAGELADWLNWRGLALSVGDNAGPEFIRKYRDLRARQSSVRASFVARLGKFHLYDPRRHDRTLGLQDGLRFSIRTAKPDGKPSTPGTPPLLNPLPDGGDIPQGQKDQIKNFLRKLDEGRWDWASAKEEENHTGSIRSGVIHTIEFASELCAVLRRPSSEHGVIERLDFSALGASGSMWVSFDEGRTKFVAEFSEGQLTRLKKVRIGRVGVLWNRAIHVVVYERTVAPSAQFAIEQNGNQLLGWPVLRKTEEYVEPTEMVRAFEAGPDSPGATGFVEASEFVTPRIHVNGAWGRDLSHGYEIPLWNQNEDGGFYPKPHVALRVHSGGGQSSRAWHDRPDELVFYTNTETGTGSDPDSWAAQPGVDVSDVGPLRRRVSQARQGAVLAAETVPSPLPESGRRPRFEFRVTCDGPANLQHGRGETTMQAVVQVIALARTVATGADENRLPPDVQAELKRVRDLSDANAKLGQVQDEVDAFVRQVSGYLLRCSDLDRLKGELKRLAKNFFDRLEAKIGTVPDVLTAVGNTLPSLQPILMEELGKRLGVPRGGVDEVLGPFEKGIGEELERVASENGIAIQARLKGFWAGVEAIISQTVEAINGSMTDAALAALKEFSKACQNDLVPALVRLAAMKGTVGGNKEELHEILGKIRKFRGSLAGVRVDRVKTLVRRIDQVANQVESVAEEMVAAADALILTGVMKSLSEGFLEVASKVGSVSAELDKIVDELSPNSLGKRFRSVQDVRDGIHKSLFDDWSGDIGAIRTRLKGLATGFRALRASYRRWGDEVESQFRKTSQALDSALGTISLNQVKVAKAYRSAVAVAGQDAIKWIQDRRGEVDALIDMIADTNLAALNSARLDIEDKLKVLRQNAEKFVTSSVMGVVEDLASTPAAKAVDQLRQWSDRAGKSIKLVRAVGDLPELPSLTFNAARAEYIFDDLKKEIETSPFAVRLREIDGGLKELGVAIPTSKLLDQFVPDIGSFDFNQIYRNLGGVELAGMLQKFRLPELSGEQVKITHGTDAATRTAWVKARIQADYTGEQNLFELGGLAVNLSDLHLRGRSDVVIGLDGSRRSVIESAIECDWSLVFGGTQLIAFRDVKVAFDGRRFDFNISPDKVELHPALRFINEIGKRLGEKIPPAITVDRDSRGIPSGVSANLTTTVRNPPPLGPVTLGTFAITAGLGLSVESDGKFLLKTHVSLGSKEAPLFLQIGFLGGGLWMSARASHSVGGSTKYSVDLGMAIGSTCAVSLGGVAHASYAILLFAYATFDEKGGGFRTGLSMNGCARILGICSAHVSLLLEVSHQSNGESGGRGVLAVEVDICWCYTLRVRRSVQQKL